MLRLLAIPAVWLASDLIYSLSVRHRLRCWQKRQEYSDGLRCGTEAFSIGEGKTALLLVHGFGDTPSIFRGLAGQLAEEGFHCRAMRLPGAGEPVHLKKNHVADHWRNAIADELAELKQNYDRVGVVAHSMGSAVLLNTLGRLADDPDFMVLLAPLFKVSARRSLGIPPAFIFRVFSRLLIFTRIYENFLPFDLRYPGPMTGYVGGERFHPLQEYRALFEILDNIPDHVDLPLLMLLPQSDHVVCTQTAEKWFEDLRASGCEKHVVPRTGHALPLESAVDEVASEISRFAGAARR